jgi:glycosyltransferase involved in cell wall biosynthesis
VLLQCLVEALKENPEVELRVLDTGRILGMGVRGLCRFGRLLCRLYGAVRDSDVVTLHCCSTMTLPIIGSLVLLLSRFLHRPFIFRKFAGDDYRATLGVSWAWLAEFVLRHADLYLAETRHLVAQAAARGLNNVRWFPTSRPFLKTGDDDFVSSLKPDCQRFVYVGHIREYKGMQVLAEAAMRLPYGVTIDVYGPWFEDLDRHVFDNSPTIHYQGVLKPEDVVTTMRKYDAAVLPTQATTDGYPGMVLESYAAGLPIVASQIGGIPEIVDDTVGILVEPKNAEDLCQAMTRLVQDRELFQRLRSNTRAKAEFFSSQCWAEEFVKSCQELRRNKMAGAAFSLE